MIKKTMFAAVVSGVLLAGCSSQPTTGFITNPDNDVVVGTQNTSIGAWHWVHKSKDMSSIDYRITIYFDKLGTPFEYDLCDTPFKQQQVVLKLIKNSKTGKQKTLTEMQNADCKTVLQVNEIGETRVDYGLRLKALLGYNVTEQFGELNYLPSMFRRNAPSFSWDVYNFNEDVFMEDKTTREAIYFTFKK